jgi:hypothetical protein
MRQYRANEIGVEISGRTLNNIFNDARSGGFVRINGYVNREGEVANHIIQFGVNYGNLVASDIATCEAILRGEQPSYALDVVRGVWMDTLGQEHTRKAKDRTYMTVRTNLTMADSRLETAVNSVLNSLRNPAPARAEYDKEAKGFYSLEGEPERLYIRDALRVWKQIIQAGEYGQTASAFDVAAKDAVRRNLKTGRYRQFNFADGAFDSIVIGGMEVLHDGVDSQSYVAMPAPASAPALALA